MHVQQPFAYDLNSLLQERHFTQLLIDQRIFLLRHLHADLHVLDLVVYFEDSFFESLLAVFELLDLHVEASFELNEEVFERLLNIHFSLCYIVYNL